MMNRERRTGRNAPLDFSVLRSRLITGVLREDSAGLAAQKPPEAVESLVDHLLARRERETSIAFHAEGGALHQVDMSHFEGGGTEAGRVGDLAAAERLAE